MKMLSRRQWPWSVAMSKSLRTVLVDEALIKFYPEKKNYLLCPAGKTS